MAFPWVLFLTKKSGIVTRWARGFDYMLSQAISKHPYQPTSNYRKNKKKKTEKIEKKNFEKKI